MSFDAPVLKLAHQNNGRHGRERAGMLARVGPCSRERGSPALRTPSGLEGGPRSTAMRLARRARGCAAGVVSVAPRAHPPRSSVTRHRLCRRALLQALTRGSAAPPARSRRSTAPPSPRKHPPHTHMFRQSFVPAGKVLHHEVQGRVQPAAVGLVSCHTFVLHRTSGCNSEASRSKGEIHNVRHAMVLANALPQVDGA